MKNTNEEFYDDSKKSPEEQNKKAKQEGFIGITKIKGFVRFEVNNIMKIFIPTICILLACSKSDTAIDATNIHLDKKNLVLNSGESYTFTVNILPSNAEILKYNWTISDINYAYKKGSKIGPSISDDGTVTSDIGCTFTVHVEAIINKKNSLRDQCKITVTPDITEFYNTFCYGFMIKDTTGITSGENIYYYPEKSKNDTTYIVGLKKDKIWIGTFNTSTKEQIDEWIDNEATNKIQKVYTGYGKYTEISINKIHLSTYIKKGDNNIIEFILDKNSMYSLLIFSKKNNIKRYFYCNYLSQSMVEWYNNSYLLNINTNFPYNPGLFVTCFSEDGDILVSGNLSRGWRPDYWFPVNYDIYLSFDYFEGLNIEKRSISTDNRFWRSSFCKNVAPNSPYTLSLININNNIWTFEIDITDFSGDNHSYIYDIDINNGVVTNK